MSGLLTGIGGAFVADTGRASGLAGAFAVTKSLAANPVDLGTADLAPDVALAGALGAVQPVGGDLGPIVALSAVLSQIWGLGGDLGPSVVFAGDMTVGTTVVLGAADLAPSVAFAGDLQVGGTVDLVGDLAISAAFAADMTSGPLWAPATRPPDMWTPVVDECSPVNSLYGVNLYGVGLYSAPSGRWVEKDKTPSPWKKVTPCNG